MRIEISRQAVQQRSSYIRTITDIDRFLTGDRTKKNILIALEYLHEVTREGGMLMVDDYDFFSTGVKTAAAY